MAQESQGIEPGRPRYRSWLLGPLVFLALLVVARFVLEVAGTPVRATRVLSSAAAVLLVAIYLGAVAPLHGARKSAQLILPGIIVAAWTQAWVILATLVSGGLSLERSHFADPEDYGNWKHLWGHVFDHVRHLLPSALVVLVLMATMLLLWRWPVTVGPGAILGGLVMMRFLVEAMEGPATVASAWSSTIGALLSALFLGGVGPRLGLNTARQLLVPALVLGWTWRFWIFVAAVMNAAAPYYKTHFFDPTKGRVFIRLAGFFGGEVLVVGFVAGLLVWGIAVWTSHIARLAAEA